MPEAQTEWIRKSVAIHEIGQEFIDKMILKDDALMYHYTGADVLKMILEDSSLRFADCRFLNDYNEMNYGLKQIKQIVSGHKQRGFLKFLLQNLYSRDFIENHEIRFVNGNDEVCCDIERYYVFCGSYDKDNKVLWEYYSKNNSKDGYNLGLDVRKLDCYIAQMQKPRGKYGMKGFRSFGRVIYDKAEQRRLIKTYLEQILEIGLTEQDAGHPIIRPEIERFLLLSTLFMKEESFANEAEYRVVLSFAERQLRDIEQDIDGKLKLKYVVNGGAFTPKMDITVGSLSEIVDKITISPYNKMDYTKQGLIEYLKSSGKWESSKLLDGKDGIEKSKITIRY